MIIRLTTGKQYNLRLPSDRDRLNKYIPGLRYLKKQHELDTICKQIAKKTKIPAYSTCLPADHGCVLK